MLHMCISIQMTMSAHVFVSVRLAYMWFKFLPILFLPRFTTLFLKCGLYSHLWNWQSVYSQVELLSRLCSPYLLTLLGYCSDNNHKLLVYEFMANGGLQEHLYPLNGELYYFLFLLFLTCLVEILWRLRHVNEI